MPAETGVGSIVTALNKILAVVGVALLMGGLGLGFRSVSAGGTDCGSAFQPAAGITPMACDGRLNSSATVVAVVLIAGAICLVAAFTLKYVRDRARV
jgi:hypothetical protein